MEASKKGGLVVPFRPQISVEESEEIITISITSISDDFEKIEHKDICFPIECAQDVASAILDLLKQ